MIARTRLVLPCVAVAIAALAGPPTAAADEPIPDLPVPVPNVHVAPPVNHGPVAQHGRASTNEDTPVLITLPVTDPDGDPLEVFTTTPQSNTGWLHQVNPDGSRGPALPLRGWHRVSDPAYRVWYVPTPDAHAVPYTVIYFYGRDERGRVTSPTPEEGATRVLIDVHPVNDPPSYQYGIEYGTTKDRDILGVTPSFSDRDGDPLTIEFIEFPERGALYRGSIAPENLVSPTNRLFPHDGTTYWFTWEKPTGCRAELPWGHPYATFNYRATDGQYWVTSGPVNLHVVNSNDPPIGIGPTHLGTTRDTAVRVNLEVTDAQNDFIEIDFPRLPAHGRLFFRWGENGEYAMEITPDHRRLPLGYPDGQYFEYVPNPGYFGPDSFTWIPRDWQAYDRCGEITTTVKITNR